MEQLRSLFKARDLSTSLKHCKLFLNASKIDPNLEQLGIEMWNTAVKQNLNPQFKLCAFILFLRVYQDKTDSKSHLKLLAMASRLMNESTQSDKDYIYQLCTGRLEIIIGMLSTSTLHANALDQVLPVILNRLETGWTENDLASSLFYFEKLIKIKMSKETCEQIFAFLVYIYESHPHGFPNCLSLFSIADQLSTIIHSNSVLLSKFYLYSSEMAYDNDDLDSAASLLVKSTDNFLLLGAVVMSIKLPNFIAVPLDQFIFECLPSIDMRHEQYSHVLLLYNDLCKVSLKSANSLLEILISKSRRYPLKCQDIFHKTTLLYFQSLIESQETQQIELFINDCMENMLKTPLINSICVLLWIKGDSCISDMLYSDALKYFEPSLRILDKQNVNIKILQRKICFCKLQLNKLLKEDLTDDLFLQFQFYLSHEQPNECIDILNKLQMQQESAVLIGCASLAYQKKSPELLLLALEKMHLCGPVDICLTRAAIRLALKVNCEIPVILNILEHVEVVDDKKWFFNVIWNVCLKHHETDLINSFTLLGMNLRFVPDDEQHVNTLLFLCSIGCEIIKMGETTKPYLRIKEDIDSACHLIAKHEKTDLIEIAAQMQFEIYCLFKCYDEAAQLIPSFQFLENSEIITNICEHLEDLELPFNSNNQLT